MVDTLTLDLSPGEDPAGRGLEGAPTRLLGDFSIILLRNDGDLSLGEEVAVVAAGD